MIDQLHLPYTFHGSSIKWILFSSQFCQLWAVKRPLKRTHNNCLTKMLKIPYPAWYCHLPGKPRVSMNAEVTRMVRLVSRDKNWVHFFECHTQASKILPLVNPCTEWGERAPKVLCLRLKIYTLLVLKIWPTPLTP